MQKVIIERRDRAIVAAVQLPNVSDIEFESSVSELRELGKTLGFQVVETFTQKRASFDTTAYMGIGKRQEMRRFVDPSHDNDDPTHLDDKRNMKKAAKKGEERAKEAVDSEADPEVRRADVVLVDHEISPSQARNLEIEVGAEVMDRTMVILEIFQRHARSKAAKAQVEIARLGYMGPRLREQAKLAGPQGRQRSGTGGRGAGETHMAMDRQKIRDRIMELRQEIEAMDVERKVQRARRREREGLARVALVGYTNAGKSTLMRALTGDEVLVANKLFATLDTTVRTLEPAIVPRVLVSDTVGFIKNLPHDLVASFKSTLEEAAEASLLLHVIDASDPGYERQLKVTEEVLAEIGAQEVPRILVFNKIDLVVDEGAKEGDKAGDIQGGKEADIQGGNDGDVQGGNDGDIPGGQERGGRLDPETAQAARADTLRLLYPGCIVMSARRPENVAALHGRIRAFFQKDLVEAELFLPWSAARLRSQIFDTCEVLEERSEEDGAHFKVRANPETLKELRGALGE